MPTKNYRLFDGKCQHFTLSQVRSAHFPLINKLHICHKRNEQIIHWDRQKKNLRSSFFKNCRHYAIVMETRTQANAENYLVRQIWKQPGRNISVSQVLEDQKFDGCNCRWNCRRATFSQDDRTFFKIWKSFQLLREREDTVICHILNVGGRLSYFENWGTVEIFGKLTSNLSKNFTMKGTMSLVIG